MEYQILYLDETFCERQFLKESEMQAQIVQTRVNDCIAKIEITIANRGNEKSLIPFFEVATSGDFTFYMIPCVNYNGNVWGTGKEPKGMEREGKPWIFPADRVGLTGCSVAENREVCTALFADNQGLSKNSSASLFEREGKIYHRIYFSHIEYPYSYLRKFDYGAPIAEFLSLKGGEEKKFICYFYRFEKSGEEYYGYKKLFDFVNGENYLKEVTPTYSFQTVKEWNGEFIRSLTEKTEDGYLSDMGFLPEGEHRIGDETCSWKFRNFGKYEIGWCGQNISVAEFYLRAFLQEGNSEDKQKGLGILNTWFKRIYPCGLISANYDTPFDGSEKIDACNEGWLLYKLTTCCRLLKEMGEDVSRYESVAKRICDFFIESYPVGGFPQILTADGKIFVKDGCAGVMIMLGFAEAYSYFHDEKYLVRAKEAFRFYYETYLSKSVAAGGALDTYCIDKESAGPVLRTALKLYSLTGNKRYFDCAENIAHYLMTWCFYHDVDFDENSDCGRLGLRTTGGTAVSAAHHHIDCWGAFYVPDFCELYEKTGNRAYFRHARALWNFTLQYLSDGTLKLHGMIRPRGAQNEAVIQCNWHGADEKKGQLNDWLVAWVKTFQLDAIYALKDKKTGVIE